MEERIGTFDELLHEACKLVVLDEAAAFLGLKLEPEIDPWTGAELKPGDPEICQGNGKDPRFEICCDECDFFLACYPDTMPW